MYHINLENLRTQIRKEYISHNHFTSQNNAQLGENLRKYNIEWETEVEKGLKNEKLSLDEEGSSVLKTFNLVDLGHLIDQTLQNSLHCSLHIKLDTQSDFFYQSQPSKGNSNPLPLNCCLNFSTRSPNSCGVSFFNSNPLQDTDLTDLFTSLTPQAENENRSKFASTSSTQLLPTSTSSSSLNSFSSIFPDIQDRKLQEKKQENNIHLKQLLANSNSPPSSVVQEPKPKKGRKRKNEMREKDHTSKSKKKQKKDSSIENDSSKTIAEGYHAMNELTFGTQKLTKEEAIQQTNNFLSYVEKNCEKKKTDKTKPPPTPVETTPTNIFQTYNPESHHFNIQGGKDTQVMTQLQQYINVKPEISELAINASNNLALSAGIAERLLMYLLDMRNNFLKGFVFGENGEPLLIRCTNCPFHCSEVDAAHKKIITSTLKTAKSRKKPRISLNISESRRGRPFNKPTTHETAQILGNSELKIKQEQLSDSDDGESATSCEEESN